ncbi:hypothetical protein GCM10018787_42890 [Streptomyces thermodiastaticus]|nr:hypothetical protein GCM10018787_42890 [Streptomyces thermodiastaticus]
MRWGGHGPAGDRAAALSPRARGGAAAGRLRRREGRHGRTAGQRPAAAASAAWAFSARSTPARDSETSRRSAAFGSAD